jgi:hypothetical protein
MTDSRGNQVAQTFGDDEGDHGAATAQAHMPILEMKPGHRPDETEKFLVKKIGIPGPSSGVTDRHSGLEAETSGPAGEDRIAQNDVLSPRFLREPTDRQKIFPPDHHIASRRMKGGTFLSGTHLIGELQPVVGCGNPPTGMKVQYRSSSKPNRRVRDRLAAFYQPTGVGDAIGVDERDKVSSGVLQPAIPGGSGRERFRASDQLDRGEVPNHTRHQVVSGAVHHDHLELEWWILPHHTGEAFPQLACLLPARNDDAELDQREGLWSTR